MRPNQTSVAVGVRMEENTKTNDLYLVFKVTDEEFKQKVRELWASNKIELKLIGTELVEED